jgi:hypothetical protein
MRIYIAVSLAIATLLAAPGTVSAAPLLLSEHGAISRALSVTVVEPAAQRYLRKRPNCCRYVRRRRPSWTDYPYWRPYQYRYWKFYYPYGGPLF